MTKCRYRIVIIHGSPDPGHAFSNLIIPIALSHSPRIWPGWGSLVILGDCGSPDPGSNLGPGPSFYLASIFSNIYVASFAENLHWSRCGWAIAFRCGSRLWSRPLLLWASERYGRRRCIHGRASSAFACPGPIIPELLSKGFADSSLSKIPF